MGSPNLQLAVAVFLVVELTVIAWLFVQYLAKPLGVLSDLENLKKAVDPAVDAQIVGAYDRWPAAAQERWKSSFAEWNSGKHGAEKKSTEPLADVYRAEDYYSPRMTFAAPGLMAGMGILGTFIGLGIGVATLDVTNSTTLMTGIQSMLGSLGLAAWSSIIGIAAGLLYTGLSRSTLAKIENCCDFLNKELRRQYGVYSSGELVQRLLQDQQSILANVQSMQTDFIDKLADALYERQAQGQMEYQEHLAGNLSNGIISGVNGVLFEFSNSLQEIRGTLVPVLQSSQQLVQWLNQAAGEQRDLMSTVERVVPALRETVDQIGKITDNQRAVHDELGRLVHTGSDLAQASAASVEQAKQSLRHIREGAEAIQQASASMRSVRDGIHEIVQRFDESVERYATKTDERIQMTFSAFDRQMAAVAGKLVTVVDEMLDQMDRLPETVRLMVGHTKPMPPPVPRQHSNQTINAAEPSIEYSREKTALSRSSRTR